MNLGDMAVSGAPSAKLAKALATVAAELHPTFAREPWIEHRAKSKESCVLASLAVRDFLIAVGFLEAQVRPVATVMRATRRGETLHSLGVGMPGMLGNTSRYWNGHMVASAAGFLIDTTLYRMARPQWPTLPGMLALPYGQPGTQLLYGLKPIAAASLAQRREAVFEIVYLDAPGNTSWHEGGDAREGWRREAAVAAMRKRFGKWRER